MNITLVVLAAGLSTRYGGLKQLEPVGPSGETLLDYGIYDAVRAGYSRVVLVVRRELEHEFRERMARLYGEALDIAFAHQEPAQLPPGFALPENRTKPWGTGHAVLASAVELDGPFVAMNADDFYGASAFALLGDYLRGVGSSRRPCFAAAGYHLRDTLSPFGGVSRAVCELDEAGYIRRVTEVKQIEERDGRLSGVTVGGDPYPLHGDETISMNLWAATPAAFPLLEGEFAEFLILHEGEPEAEFLLSEAVNDLVSRGVAQVRVWPTPGPWLGVTFPEDRDYVARRLRELVELGRYPANLFEAFAAR